jgi:hypothetical protein
VRRWCGVRAGQLPQSREPGDVAGDKVHTGDRQRRQSLGRVGQRRDGAQVLLALLVKARQRPQAA